MSMSEIAFQGPEREQWARAILLDLKGQVYPLFPSGGRDHGILNLELWRDNLLDLALKLASGNLEETISVRHAAIDKSGRASISSSGILARPARELRFGGRSDEKLTLLDGDDVVASREKHGWISAFQTRPSALIVAPHAYFGELAYFLPPAAAVHPGLRQRPSGLAERVGTGA